MADDLGYAELGCYGQEQIQTPSVDRMAAEGLRFTQFYSGSPVCASARCVFMTGLHTGHAHIRSNSEVQPEGQKPIPNEAVTIAELLRERGYATGAMGKWGLGGPDSGGLPTRQGFDHWFGYLCQRQAHNFYPRYLWRNETKVPLSGNDRGLTGEQYSHDLIAEEAVQFISDHRHEPFFLYVPFTIPHLAIQVPEDSLALYRGRWPDPPYDGDRYLPHPAPRAGYAAMVSRMDRDVGRILDLVKRLGLDEDTIVFFTSDNGPTYNRLGGSDSEFFDSNGPLRGYKGSLYEGGIRVPLVVRAPGRIESGRTTDHVAAFWDVLPTLVELAGGTPPDGIDGINFLPELTGHGEQPEHEYLYWEFPSYGRQQAVRLGDWKGVRQNMARGNMEIELYNLSDDIGESQNVAAEHAHVVARVEQIMREARVPSAEFPFKELDSN
jgi:arylsulfatase